VVAIKMDAYMQARKLALMGILIFGLVSLLGDIIYEGSRGIVSPFLQNLGASALIVGVVLGLGEFLGYALRVVFGVLSDRTRSYWGLTIGGYSLLIAVPLLAFAGGLHLAVILVLLERISKAVRTPARDTLFSHVTKGMGTGKAFGLHELMDQIGAVIGPAIVAVVLLTTGGKFEAAFSVLFIPYLIMLIVLVAAYAKLKDRVSLPALPERKVGAKKLPRGFMTYSIAVAFNSMGLVSIGLILYRAYDLGTLAWIVALLYLTTQAVDAASAPLAGYAYDSVGRKLLYLPFALSILPSTLIFFGGLEFVVASALLFGVIFGMHESIYRAAVADLTEPEVRGSAYGVFHTLYGLGLMIGGAVFGLFLERGLVYLAVPYAILTQALAIFLLHKTMSSQ
jgi:MFS family permease